jgi:NDP-hexose-3-ketoreductase
MNKGERVVRFGVLGCGSIARRAMLPALSLNPRVQLVAVASRSYENAARYAAEFNCEAEVGYENLLARSDIDAVYIALPVGLHAHWAIEAAKNRKNVLCEKTLTASLQETREIIAECRRSEVALLEGFSYQFHPQHRAVNDLIAAGGIGVPILFQAWLGFPPIDSPHRYDPALGGGALLDAGTYTIHVARRFFNTEPAILSAQLDKGDKDVEIYGSVHLRFISGESALVGFGFNLMYRNSYTVWGTEGIVTLTRAFSIPAHLAPTMVLERQGCREERQLCAADQFRLEVEAFCGGLDDETQRLKWSTDALNQATALDNVRSADKQCRAMGSSSTISSRLLI